MSDTDTTEERNTENGEQPKKQRGRPKGSGSGNTRRTTPKFSGTGKKKHVQMDDELRALIQKTTEPEELEKLSVRLPKKSIEEMIDSISTLEDTGNTKISQDEYIRYALEAAEYNLHEILRMHLSKKK